MQKLLYLSPVTNAFFEGIRVLLMDAEIISDMF